MKTIRIIEIEKNNIVVMRYVKVENGLVDRRYQFESSYIFYTYKFKFFGAGFVLTPTLMYYSGNAAAIRLPGQSSAPAPEQINTILESAIIALSDLFRRGQDTKMDIMLVVMAIVALMVFYLVFVGG